MPFSEKDLKLSAGVGENQFTMSRGSFNYKQKTGGMKEFYQSGITYKDQGFDIVFTDGIETFMLSATAVEKDLTKFILKPPQNSGYNRFRITFPDDKRLHYYGCGEEYATLDLAGERVRIFDAEHQNANRIGKKLIKSVLHLQNDRNVKSVDKYESYYAQPTFVTSNRYFFHAETNRFSIFEFTRDGEVSFEFQEPPVFYIGRAESFEALSEKLSGLIGRQPRLPEWIYDGLILAVQGGSEVVDLKLKISSLYDVKICGIWSQDWCGCRKTGFGYQVMWNWEADKELYPDLPEKIKEWNEKGVRFLGYINPFLAIEKDLYRYAAEHGYCVKDKEGKDYLVTITTFPAAMIDFTNPDAYAWYKKTIQENMIGIGLSGWMADFGEYLPTDCVLYSGEDPEELHNQWPAIWAKLNREAIDEAGKQDEVFFFTRAGYTGSVKNSPMMWTGDQHVDWSADDGLPSVIPATLSLAMSGFGITHSDVGGYTTVFNMTRSKELLMRWEEMNTFSPLFRTHEGNQPTRNLQFDDDRDLLAQLELCSKWHTALKPYLLELEKLNSEKGIPVMRPLFYHYDEEKAYTEKTEYLLGRDILVAPVLEEGKAKRKVWFPDDRWIHLLTGEEYTGGTCKVKAPIGTPPVFIRKESRYIAQLQKDMK